MTTANTTTLPILPLPHGAIFPEMVVTVAAESPGAQAAFATAAETGSELVAVPERGGDYSPVGLVARIEQQGKLPGGGQGAVLRGLRRVRIGQGVTAPDGVLHVTITEIDTPPPTAEAQAAAADYKRVAAELLRLVGGRQMVGALDDLDDPGQLADTFALWPELDDDRRVQLFETVDPNERIALALAWANDALAEKRVDHDINSAVRDDFDKAQREAILRKQMETIRTELGEGADDDIAEFRAKLAELAAPGDDGQPAAMPAATVAAVDKEIDRLERVGDQSMEAGWIRTWIETVFELPWGKRSADTFDLDAAQRQLDDDHEGLDKVKDRITEFLAVRKLRHERGVANEPAGPAGRRAGGGAILALVGPPGVGKTSLGESIAASMGRSFVRMSLGGVRDEAEIRGHRRTYVGARPGRLVRAMIDADSMNPVILLDEIDKVGNDWRGDPSSALLEVLDPAQNATFRDHYLETELDLSEVVFIATANVLDTIPAPLLDRMEIINIEGYTETEKVEIARNHLLPRLYARNGVRPDEVEISDDMVRTVVADYTREAGVRRLEQRLDRLVRKAASELVKDPSLTRRVIGPDDLRPALGRTAQREDPAERTVVPGVATGLAVTGAGGDVLFVEVSASDTESATSNGALTLTGQLGDVMKESGQIVLSYLRANATRLGLPEGSHLRRDFHVHFPAGAVPKDGPSAGVTMTTAFVSLLRGVPMRSDVAMTGEISLHGRVLPIGGVKEKLLAAHRAGVTDVVLPEGNRDDLDDVPEQVLDELTVHFASAVDDVLAVAFAPTAGR